MSCINYEDPDGGYVQDDEPTNTEIEEQKVDLDEDCIHEKIANKF